MKTTLCETCKFGLVRETDCGDPDCKIRHWRDKCLLGNDFMEHPITLCTQYRKKKKAKTTYHDPDFNDYLRRIVL
jgi:hypothetical protein